MNTYMKIISLICLVFVISLFITLETDVYIRMDDYRVLDRIDMLVKIDGEEVINDTVTYHAFIPIKIKHPMRLGFHKVKVSSTIANLKTQKTVFLFFRQYLLIEFFAQKDNLDDTHTFLIETAFNPYYFE